MNNKKLNHTTYDCKYHIVWIPKYRKKVIYGHLRKYLGEVFRDLALQRESEILEGHLMGDHAFMTALSGSQYKPPALPEVIDCIGNHAFFIRF